MDLIDARPNYDESYGKARYVQYIKMIDEKLKNHQKPHDRRYRQGFFIPKRPFKCMNIMDTAELQPIVWRSSWEKQFFEWCDNTDAVIRWGSEIIKILYKNPIKNRMSFYEPDIYIEILNNEKKIKKYLIEIKPMKESSLKEASNGYDKLMVAKNALKWASAIQYCKKRDITFKVMTEYDLGIGSFN